MSQLTVNKIIAYLGAAVDFPQGLTDKGHPVLDIIGEIIAKPAGAAAKVALGNSHYVQSADGVWRGALLQGNLSIDLSKGSVVLTRDQFNNSSFDLVGALTSNTTVTVPDNEPQPFIMDNKTTGAFTVIIKHAVDVGVIVAQGASLGMYSNGLVIESVQATASPHFHKASDINDLNVKNGVAGLNANAEVINLPAGAAAAAIINPFKILHADGTWADPVAANLAELPAIYIEQVEAQGVNGGSTLAVTENVIPFNVAVENTIVGALFDPVLHRITIPAGTYLCMGLSSIADGANRAVTLMYNLTAATLIGTQTNYNGAASVGLRTLAFAGRKYTFTVATTLEFRVYTQTALASFGMGLAANKAPYLEHYASAHFVKIA